MVSRGLLYVLLAIATFCISSAVVLSPAALPDPRVHEHLPSTGVAFSPISRFGFERQVWLAPCGYFSVPVVALRAAPAEMASHCFETIGVNEIPLDCQTPWPSRSIIGWLQSHNASLKSRRAEGYLQTAPTLNKSCVTAPLPARNADDVCDATPSSMCATLANHVEGVWRLRDARSTPRDLSLLTGFDSQSFEYQSCTTDDASPQVYDTAAFTATCVRLRVAMQRANVAAPWLHFIGDSLARQLWITASLMCMSNLTSSDVARVYETIWTVNALSDEQLYTISVHEYASERNDLVTTWQFLAPLGVDRWRRAGAANELCRSSTRTTSPRCARATLSPAVVVVVVGAWEVQSRAWTAYAANLPRFFAVLDAKYGARRPIVLVGGAAFGAGHYTRSWRTNERLRRRNALTYGFALWRSCSAVDEPALRAALAQLFGPRNATCRRQLAFIDLLGVTLPVSRFSQDGVHYPHHFHVPSAVHLLHLASRMLENAAGDVERRVWYDALLTRMVKARVNVDNVTRCK